MADDITIDWHGLDDMCKRLRRADEEMWAAADEGMTENAEDLLGRAQTDAPKDEGTLAGSGSVQDASSDDEITKIVGFNTAYAAVQHERTDYEHKIGKAKYLFDNLMKMAKRYYQNVADRIRRVRS